MSICTRKGILASALSIPSGSGITSRKLPPTEKSMSILPSAAASSISGVVKLPLLGTSKPYCSLSPAAVSGVTALPPGKAVAYAPISAPPCTPECPRIGISPQPSRPTNPPVKATLIIACTLSSPQVCWVIPIPQIKTALSASLTICA